MIRKKHKSNMQNRTENLEPELLNNFMRYWSLRKSNPFIADNVIKQLKSKEASTWFGLIESNHKFRATYGEELANELIRSIEDEDK